MAISPQRREAIIGRLRRGTVPHSSLTPRGRIGAVRGGAGRRAAQVASGGSVFKAVRAIRLRKTFFARWLGSSPQNRLCDLRVQVPKRKTRCIGWRRSIAG